MFSYYEMSNMIGSAVEPSAVHVMQNPTAAYFCKYLLEKAIAVFKWELPKTWDKDYFLYSLYINGFVGVFDTGAANFGVLPQWGTLDGFNVFYAPLRFRCANPLIGTIERTIHVDCELIKLEGNYTGIWDLIAFYASKMALLSEALDMNAGNVKTSKIFFTRNKAAAETVKKLTDNVQSGSVCTVLDSDLLDENGKFASEWFNDNLKQNYIVSDLLMDLRKLENEFCTDLGIPNSNTEKRERLITDEVNSNNTETRLRSELWLERLKTCCDRVNDMFNLNLSVEWRIKPNESNSFDSGIVGDGRNNSKRDNSSGRIES